MSADARGSASVAAAAPGVVGPAIAAALSAQSIGLILHDLARDPAGHPLEVAPVNALMLQLPLYATALLLQAGLWVAMRRLVPVARRVVDPVMILGLLLSVALSAFDLGLQQFRGERLGWNHFTSYDGAGVLNADWLDPVREGGILLGLQVAVLVGAAVGLGVLVWRSVRTTARASDWWHPGALCAAAAMCFAPTMFAYFHQREMAMPPQSRLVGEWRARRRPVDGAGRRAADQALRAAIGGGSASPWIDSTYPLWGLRFSPRMQVPAARPAATPDIIVFMVESLRGRDVGWGFGAERGPTRTPHLDSLAATGVRFPHWISNGDPSPRGFITLHSGVWEHSWGFIVSNFPNTRLDALPARLRARGYRNYAFWGGNPSFDGQLTRARQWYDTVAFERSGNEAFYFRPQPDAMVMAKVRAAIAAHDRDHSSQPFFAYVASNGTHTPFVLDGDPSPPADRQARYDRVLREADAQIGRVIAALRARPRWRETIVVVLGDHSDVTNEPSDPRWRGLPTDAAVATAAFISGPRALIGEPRTVDATVSHVDLLPTVMGWIGDTTPVTTMGRDLFDPATPLRRDVVAINGRGYRLDRDGYTLVVSRDDPQIHYAWKSFTGERPTPLPLHATPFAPDDPRRLTDWINAWGALVEQNRVRPPF
ncbi:MAG: sulfatase-like hydrolase/transferase [Gemmatimonadaceae bacterium]|nr:sulfatase-like hydrolase/transferase [Gemmatimonadaceae bacterium]